MVIGFREEEEDLEDDDEEEAVWRRRRRFKKKRKRERLRAEATRTTLNALDRTDTACSTLSRLFDISQHSPSPERRLLFAPCSCAVARDERRTRIGRREEESEERGRDFCFVVFRLCFFRFVFLYLKKKKPPLSLFLSLPETPLVRLPSLFFTIKKSRSTQRGPSTGPPSAPPSGPRRRSPTRTARRPTRAAAAAWSATRPPRACSRPTTCPGRGAPGSTGARSARATRGRGRSGRGQPASSPWPWRGTGPRRP